jgi:hypothetical protein
MLRPGHLDYLLKTQHMNLEVFKFKLFWPWRSTLIWERYECAVERGPVGDVRRRINPNPHCRKHSLGVQELGCLFITQVYFWFWRCHWAFVKSWAIMTHSNSKIYATLFYLHNSSWNRVSCGRDASKLSSQPKTTGCPHMCGVPNGPVAAFGSSPGR